MSVTSGFFNSFNGDRRYNAEQMSAIFDGIITDGVFANIGTAFSVKASLGVTLNIGIGRAWFNSTWVYNDAILPIECDISEVALDRIDAIVIEIDRSDSVRAGTIKFVKGTPSENPVAPTMVKTTNVHQYPLAYIRRVAGSGDIKQADITNKIGTSDCPYITGILQVQNIDNIVAQWEDQWNQWFSTQTSTGETEADEWMAQMQATFDVWFDSLQTILDEDTAANLANQIVDLQGKFETLAKERCVYDDLEDSNGTKIEDSNGSIIQGRTSFIPDENSGGSVDYDTIQAIQAEMDQKQDKLYGTPDQYVGFNEDGDAVPVAGSRPKSEMVSLSVSGWSESKTQTVYVEGVLADESAQLILPTPSITSQAAYNAAGIRCTNQTENYLTFTATVVPSSSIVVYVVMQEVI